MADTEDYFPRGGIQPTVHYFKQSGNFLGAAEKGEKKKKRPKKKLEGDDGYLSDEAANEVDQSIVNCAAGLRYKTAKPGVLILGRVRHVQETKVEVMLPCRMLGYVMACHISEAYNKLLEAYVNDKTDKVRELPDMFRPGQYVAVKVVEPGTKQLMLSMMPQDVNGAKMHSDLHNGCVLQAAVSSVEDHGYVMDVGIPGTRAFLPKSSANPEVDLDTGMITWCCVKSMSPSSDSSVLTLTSHLDALQQGVLRQNPRSPLLPGTALDFTVDKPLESGIQGRVLGGTTAYIQRQHVHSGRGKKPALGQRIRARVLYVMPTRNTPFLTTRNIFEVTYPDLQDEQKFKSGDIIDDAQVIKIARRTIHFRLGAGSVGTMSVRRLQVDEDLTDEQVLSQTYPIGSTHEVRVLCYNLSDYTYSVSDQPEVVNEKYFSVEQLSVGQLVSATVSAVADAHVTVNVGRVQGFVPHAHLSDAGVFIDPKKPRASKLGTKFKVGQEVTARILSIDTERQSLFLTLKPSLLAPDLEVLQSYEQAEAGKAYTGVIKHIRDYILVTFFNNVTAFVPRNFISKEPVEALSDAFHVGQIVTCTILQVDAGAKKMSGSFVTVPFTPTNDRKITKRKVKDTDEVPTKKHKADEDTLKSPKKKGRDKNKSETHDEVEDETKSGRKKKQGEKSEDTVEEKKDLKMKKNKKADKAKVNNGNETGLQEVKKKKKNVSECSEESDFIDTGLPEGDKKHQKKKNKKLEVIEKSESTQDTQEINKKKLKKKNKNPEHSGDSKIGIDNIDRNSKRENKLEISEESDAIETDIYEDSDQFLAPQDIGLIDFTDCVTAKDYKKRVVSLLKSVNARTRRIDVINKKIDSIEERGIVPKNEKYHRAMQMDKIVVETRIKKLMEAMKTAQEKLKEFDLEENEEYKMKQAEKRKKSMLTEETKGGDVKKEVQKKIKAKSKEIQVVESLEPALEVPSAKDFWSGNAESLTKKVEEDESSSSEDEENDQPKKKRKKLTVAEKLAKVREEEERVREMERRAIESESQPRSSEQFERALLANPDCSQLWIAYMAFHLQATEMEKARAVGRKALNTISFREELERRNVWLALLNCEHRFGTKESQQKTLEEALQMNDTYKIHSAFLDILAETGKLQDLSSLVDLMLRKYKRDPQMYLQCGAACFKVGMVDKARQVMQKAVAVLEKKEHVSILVQFALLERSHGARERAEALFDQVLAVYPARVDVCSQYVDMLMKSGDKDLVRQVMERMTSQKLPARKMKVLYKKWIEVEERLGDQAQVDIIRQRAMEYIDKAKF